MLSSLSDLADTDHRRARGVSQLPGGSPGPEGDYTGQWTEKNEGLRRSFAWRLKRLEAAEYRAGPNVRGVGGAARDRDHRNLPNNQVARQPLKQSPKRSCAEAPGASFVPSREGRVKRDGQASRGEGE